MDLDALRRKPARFGVGLMSGTSCDGIDAALVRLKNTGGQLAVKLLAHQHFSYSAGFRNRLLSEHLSARDVCLLNFEVGARLAEAVLALQRLAEKDGGIEVDFAASHGHTIAHYPPPHHDPAATLQIGEPAVIAERTGLPVISDFRQRDMAAGGQGAPLVPYADWVLFHAARRRMGCLNIGGIANFTIVRERLEDVTAYDSGPGNMVIDGAMRLLTKGQRQMDEDGAAAAKGFVLQEFLEYLLDHPYFDRSPPKSTGREEFGANVYLRDALLARKDHTLEDLVATVTEAVAISICESYRRFVQPDYLLERLIVSGGGAYNKTLMKRVRELMPGVDVYTSSQYGMPNTAREATAFAILGNETICGTPNNVPQSTGASAPVVLGKITPP